MMTTPLKTKMTSMTPKTTPISQTPSPSFQKPRHSRSISIPLPTLSQSSCVMSSVLSTHAKGLVDQKSYIMFLQTDTKKLYIAKSLIRHEIETVRAVDMSETADGSSSLLIDFQNEKLRIRVSTESQAVDWTKTIVNLLKHKKICSKKKQDNEIETLLQGVHKYDEVWIWNDKMISWEKAYLEVSSNHITWAFHVNTLTTTWSSLRVGKQENVGRSHSYFTVEGDGWRVQIRLARSRADLWHNILLQVGKPLEVKDEKKLLQRRRASIGVVCREIKKEKNEVKPISFWKSLSKESWMNDNESTRCVLCNVSFSLFLRRHHCRGCGRLVCDRCSQGRVRSKKSKTTERACDRCVVSLFCPPREISPAATAIASSNIEEVSKKMMMDPKENERREKVTRFRKQLMEIARGYEFQIRRQHRALAEFRGQHIERLEMECQDREAERREKNATPPTTPLMEKIKTAIDSQA